MTALVDTSILIDVLRNQHGAPETLVGLRSAGPVHASEVTRIEVLAGMRSQERSLTLGLLDSLTWHPVDHETSERAAAFAREFQRSHSGIDIADCIIAATADLLGARLITRNVKHFPMFDGLTPPY